MNVKVRVEDRMVRIEDLSVVLVYDPQTARELAERILIAAEHAQPSDDYILVRRDRKSA